MTRVQNPMRSVQVLHVRLVSAPCQFLVTVCESLFEWPAVHFIGGD